MANKTLLLNQKLYDYALSISLREPEILQELREATAESYNLEMQIAPEQGQFMGLLLKLMQARRTIELGVFTGYSTLATALALPDDGYILACDKDPVAAALAQKFWRKALVEHKIDLQLGDAKETLAGQINKGYENTFDFAFIDADKENYDTYYENCLKLIKPNGFIAIDNIFKGGDIIDETKTGPGVEAIRHLNQKIKNDPRVDISLIAIGDGLTLARKKHSSE